MKKAFYFLLFALLLSFYAQAQNSTDSTASNPAIIRLRQSIVEKTIQPNPFMLPIARASIRGSYPIELSYFKTTHIIFPTKIIDFDAGSEVVIATVPEGVQNILRVKSDVKGFNEETNMTVLTEDGGYYSFLVRYNEHPEVISINITNNIASDRYYSNSLGIGLGSNNSTNVYMLKAGTYNTQTLRDNAFDIMNLRATVRNVGAKKDRVGAYLRGIYSDQEVIYFKIELNNRSSLAYQMDFLKVFVRDSRQLKRMATQEEELPILDTQPASLVVAGHSAKEQVIAIPKYSLEVGRVMRVEVYEKNGGRHLTFEIDNDILTNTVNIQ